MKYHQFTKHHINELVTCYKPRGLVKFRNLPKKYKIWVQRDALMGQSARVLVEAWGGWAGEPDPPPYLKKALTALSKAWGPTRSPIYVTMTELAAHLFDTWAPLKHETWRPELDQICEKIACAIFLNEFTSYCFNP